MTTPSDAGKDPRRVAAGQRNQALRGPWTAEQREAVRQATLRHKPWRFSTGPKTTAGKRRSAENGKKHQRGELSVRQLRAAVSDVDGLIFQMAESCRRTTGS